MIGKFVALLGIAALLAVAAAPSVGSPARGNPEVCATTKYDGTCEVQPNKLVAGARAIIRKIHWKTWGGRHAVGVGTLKIFPSVGQPDSQLISTARVKMSEIRSCDGRRRYQRAPFTYADNDGNRQHARALVFKCGDFKGAASSFAAQSCDPPAGTFYYSVQVTGVRCRQAGRVLTQGECDNASCSRFSYGGWRCRVKGGLQERVTRCRHGNNRIVAHAAGDKRSLVSPGSQTFLNCRHDRLGPLAAETEPRACIETFSQGGYVDLRSLRWRGWGDPKAKAKGKAQHGASPPFPIRINVDRLHRCNSSPDSWFYARMKVILEGYSFHIHIPGC